MNVDFFVHFSFEKRKRKSWLGANAFMLQKKMLLSSGKKADALFSFRKKGKSQGAKSENKTTSQYLDFFIYHFIRLRQWVHAIRTYYNMSKNSSNLCGWLLFTIIIENSSLQTRTLRSIGGRGVGSWEGGSAKFRPGGGGLDPQGGGQDLPFWGGKGGEYKTKPKRVWIAG